MRIKPIAAIVLRQYYLTRTSVSRIFPHFAWVAVDIVLWGFITRYLNSVSSSRVSFVLTLLGAVLLWDFFTRVMQGITIAFFEDVWAHNFLNLFSTPISVSEYLAGLVLTSIITSLVALGVMMSLAALLFRLSFFSYGIAFFPFVLILFLFGIALGILASSIVLRLGPSSEWFIWPIPAIISPFAAVFYPITILPKWMQWISYALPPSYVFNGLRAIVAGGGVSPGLLFLGGTLAAGYILLTCWIFTRVYRHAVKSGLIPRYTAESL